jgi:hypothetical protein
MDTYKPAAKLTLNAGARITWNANPVNRQGLFARPAGSFLDTSHQVNQPLNQVILTGLKSNFPSTPLLVYQPRVSAAYQLAPGTAVHLGFGLFNDIIPAQVADLASTNPPYSPVFVGGLGGQVGGIARQRGRCRERGERIVSKGVPCRSCAMHRYRPGRADLSPRRQPQYFP